MVADFAAAGEDRGEDGADPDTKNQKADDCAEPAHGFVGEDADVAGDDGEFH